MAVVVVLAIVWLFFLGGMGPQSNTAPNNQDTTINVEQPIVPVNEGGGEQPY